MKNLLTLTFILFCGSFSLLIAQNNTPDFSMIGFATLNGGTTGGEGGEVVTPQTFTELAQYIESETPYVIRITKEFNTGVETWVDENGGIVESTTSGAISTTFGAILRVGSNKTLQGIGDQAFLNRIGLVIQCQSNIIIRNIRFTMLHVPATRDGEYKILDTDGVTTLGDPDCIGIQADKDDIPEAERISEHIWIDHCEFYNENIDNKDRYDGLLDAKNKVQHMTISWCYFHDHSKAMLSGKGSSDDYNRTVTYHHNYFSQINGSRLPLLRFGQHHYFNNYLENCEGDGVNMRINANAYIENNYFNNVKKPVFGKLSENGQAVLKDNIFESCSRLPEGITNNNGAKSDPLSSSEEFVRACNFTPSDLYTYQQILTETSLVPEVVKTYSGVGKISEDITATQNTAFDVVKVFASDAGISIKNGQHSTLTIYAISGQVVKLKTITESQETIWLNRKGVYMVKMVNGNQSRSWKVIL